MINQQLLNPKSIAVIGASNDTRKPGGKILKNIIGGGFQGDLYAVNRNETDVQKIKCFANIDGLPQTDLAVLAIAARYCVDAVETLARQKGTKAFIIISAGFSEESEEGAQLEREITAIVNSINGCLIGPNCIGIITPFHHSVFPSIIPKLDPKGCDFISGSGATAVFIMESGLPKGLRFASVFSVGNSAQTGVEEILQYMDETFDPVKSSRIKLLYIESIRDPDKFLRHTSSLIRKGCKIAAIKAGGSEAGSRAASSHTGAMVSNDLAVEALFRKAGITRCFGREELTTVACVLMHKEIKGTNIAIITHAGGPAVMLTDALSKGGLEIPKLDKDIAGELKLKLLPGSSTQNPIDMLATGTAEQLGIVIDYCENHFTNIDAMMVIFGSPGLVEVFDAYKTLHEKMESCSKPIFPILPSISIASREVEYFLSKGHVNFPDEVSLGNAVIRVHDTPKPAESTILTEGVNVPLIKTLIGTAEDGYLPTETVRSLLQAASIPVVPSAIATNEQMAAKLAKDFGFPVVMKVVGPLHKTDVGGVTLNIKTENHLFCEFERLMKIKDTTGVLIQPMLKGTELFAGASYEPKFGHLVLCGLGGIFVEVLKDVASGLAPLTYNEAFSMIRSLRGYKIIKGTRGQEGVNEQCFADVMVRLSVLLRYATEIKELDLNPLIGKKEKLTVVDARIRIEKNQ
jgi:acetate---CoA ligase (ADP-forming)